MSCILSRPKPALYMDFPMRRGPSIAQSNDISTRMSKRAPQEYEDGHDAFLKRQKLSLGGAPAAVVQEDIQSSRQLQTLLAFQQDDAAAKHGM